ncbi:MAG: MFS transporter [Candidatus Thermoplasmatota archaeon]
MRSTILKGLTWNVILLGIISLLTDASTEMIVPVLPLFLYEVLHAPLLVIGLLEGAAESTASILKALAGYWSDRIRRRKPFLLSGYGLSTVSKALLALSAVWQHVIVLRVIERIGKGVRGAPRDAMIAECTDRNCLGRVYGFHRAMDTAGAVVGVLISLTLVTIVALGYREIFLLSVIPGAAAVLVILFLREGKVEMRKVEKGALGSFKELPAHLRIFVLALGCLTIGAVSTSFLLLRVAAITHSPSLAIALYLLFNLVYMGGCIPAGMLSDRLGKLPLIITGYAVLTAMFCLAALTSDLWGIALVFVLFGVFFALTEGTQRAYVAEHAPEHLKGTALGAYHSAIGLGALPLGLAAGMIGDLWGAGFTFVFGAVLSLIGVLILIALGARRPPAHRARS